MGPWIHLGPGRTRDPGIWKPAYQVYRIPGIQDSGTPGPGYTRVALDVVQWPARSASNLHTCSHFGSCLHVFGYSCGMVKSKAAAKPAASTPMKGMKGMKATKSAMKAKRRAVPMKSQRPRFKGSPDDVAKIIAEFAKVPEVLHYSE